MCEAPSWRLEPWPFPSTPYKYIYFGNFFNEWKEQRGLIFYGLGFSSSWIKAIICSYQKKKEKKSDYGVVSQKIGLTLNQPKNFKTSNRYA